MSMLRYRYTEPYISLPTGVKRQIKFKDNLIWFRHQLLCVQSTVTLSKNILILGIVTNEPMNATLEECLIMNEILSIVMNYTYNLKEENFQDLQDSKITIKGNEVSFETRDDNLRELIKDVVYQEGARFRTIYA